ncbi:MAG TPA: hypothetical protein VKK79_22045 [Candidatus Lokiarchaeia archaeon]|nr:hypothetical protein [Candidatus Lokiarchaeia archaeon]
MSHTLKIPDLNRLRREAEQKLQNECLQGGDSCPAFPKDDEEFLHELQVQKIEIDMQNEELIQASEDIRSIREKMANLCDLAPDAHFILDQSGKVEDATFSASNLLGIGMEDLINAPFTTFRV